MSAAVTTSEMKDQVQDEDEPASPNEEDEEEEEEEEEEIDPDQIQDYQTMLTNLGTFPEKVAINSLSMAAEDFSSSPTSARIIYNCIRDRLLDRTTPEISHPDRKLPLVYVLDSLLKNVKGVYVRIIVEDAANWMGVVYDCLQGNEGQRGKLKRVWNTWREFGVIADLEEWKRIGRCFLLAEEEEKKRKIESDNKQRIGKEEGGVKNDIGRGGDFAGFPRNPDGSLKIMPSLRKQMQLLLDEVQSTGVDELDKVSLERLADINPDLLRQIKEESEIVLREQKMGSIPSSTGAAGHTSTISSHSNGNITNDWSKLKLNHLEKSNTIVTKLQRHVRSACDQNTMVVKSQVDDTVHFYAAVSASAQVLTDMLHQFQLQEKENYNTNILGYIGVGSGSGDSSRKKRYSLVRQEKFTTDGLKERNDAVVSRLYEVGLPFVCSADGRRFGTQIELSKHLDMLFKRSQLEKTMERTEERGWYTTETSWMGLSSSVDVGNAAAITDDLKSSDLPHSFAENAESDYLLLSECSNVIADESRDRCVLCGINFEMFFDQEDGEWKYKNCLEKSILSNDDYDSNDMLVHVTCWKGLGSPEFLTQDQILHAT